MPLRDEARQIFAKLGDFADLYAIDEYEDGPTWHVAVDADTFVVVELAPDRGVLVLSSDLGQTPQAERVRLASLALAYNVAVVESGGARLGMDGEGRASLLLDCAPTEERERAFAPILKRFARQAAAWRDVVSGRQRPDSTAPDTSLDFLNAIRV